MSYMSAFTIFGNEGSAPYYLYHSRAGFKSYKDYSVKGITVKSFKCPTCHRGRLFTPKGSMNYNERKDWKSARKALRVLSKKNVRKYKS